MPQPSGNRPQLAGDERTQLLPPVGKGDDATQILASFSWMLDERTLREARLIDSHLDALNREACEREGHTFTVVVGPSRGWCIHCGDVPPIPPTAVIPVTPAQPEANDSDHWKDGCPWMIAVCFVLAGALLLTGIGLGAWWF